MKKILFISCFFITGCYFSVFAAKQIFITVENTRMKQTLCFENNSLKLYSVFDKKRNTELLSNQDHIPYFEFYLNNQLVSSSLPVWNLIRHSERPLQNGGSEISIFLEGIRELKGLEIEIQRQYFPESSLLRERLKMRNTGKPEFRLDKKDGKLYFKYPQYALKSNRSQISVYEIKIGSYGKDLIVPQNPNDTFKSSRKFRNLSGCHMFHPDTFCYQLNQEERLSFKGPFGIAMMDSNCIMTTYEHASQDGVKGTVNGTDMIDTTLADAHQGVDSDWIMTDDDFHFIDIVYNRKPASLVISTELKRGGYFDNEKVPSDKFYETVWSTFSFMDSIDALQEQIHSYLMRQITTNKRAREPKFYYNTWGMQRAAQLEGKNMREVFTEARILEEINYAADLNVDLFIMDDGWQETLGVWRPHKTRLPNGLNPLIEKIKERNMIPGIWLSLMGIDSISSRYKEHQDWVVKNSSGDPISGQWNFPVFDFVSDFSKLILEDHKRLIDQGILYFKWDAVNTFNSALPNLFHGDSTYSNKEIIDRYNYMLPFYVTETMRKLREYNPEVLVEIDLTEPERCLIGLMPLQEGKFFWMNNGASGYGDYSTFRTKSMRTVINTFSCLFPPEVFTYAVYPHNAVPFFAQRYNVNTTLIAGKGLWGDLEKVDRASREKVGQTISKAKMVLPHIVGKPLSAYGKIGASPEIYQQINVESGFGQIIGFSGSALFYPLQVPLHNKNLLGVLNHAYTQTDNTLQLNFQFEFPDDTREAFMLGNQGTGIQILSSTGWLDKIELTNETLVIKTGSESILTVYIPEQYKPEGVDSYSSGNGIYLIKLGSGKEIKIRLANGSNLSHR